MAVDGIRIPPPYSVRDCEWIEMTPGKAVPEKVLNVDGTLNGDLIYVGRAYEEGLWYVGTAVPNKECCLYQNKKGEIKSSSSYEILTIWHPERLLFKAMALHEVFNRYLAGGNEEDEIYMYAARVRDGKDTYIGWADEETKTVYIPKEPELGPNKITDNYDIVIHTSNMDYFAPIDNSFIEALRH